MFLGHHILCSGLVFLVTLANRTRNGGQWTRGGGSSISRQLGCLDLRLCGVCAFEPPRSVQLRPNVRYGFDYSPKIHLAELRVPTSKALGWFEWYIDANDSTSTWKNNTL
jgi:hypothetical protein